MDSVKKDLVMVVDFDDILYEMSPLLYSTIRKNWRFYRKFFKDFGSLSSHLVYKRNEFYMNKWLLKDEIKEIATEEELSEIHSRIFQRFLDDFFSKDIYSLAPPTIFASKTLCNTFFLENSNLKKIVIISRNVHPEQGVSKKKFIEQYFNHPKIEYHTVDGHSESKSDIIKKFAPDWGLFIDDEIKNIRDVAENCDINGKEFMIPKFGYNQLPGELSILIKEKGGTVTYYDPEKK